VEASGGLRCLLGRGGGGGGGKVVHCGAYVAWEECARVGGGGEYVETEKVGRRVRCK